MGVGHCPRPDRSAAFICLWPFYVPGHWEEAPGLSRMNSALRGQCPNAPTARADPPASLTRLARQPNLFINETMSVTLEEIEREALALPAEKRARLVDRLWESLGHTTYPVLSPEWLAEIEHRRQELLQGKVKPVAGEEVSRQARGMVKLAR